MSQVHCLQHHRGELSHHHRWTVPGDIGIGRFEEGSERRHEVEVVADLRFGSVVEDFDDGVCPVLEHRPVDLSDGPRSERYGFEVRIEFLDGRSQLRCDAVLDRKSTRLNSSHVAISYAVFCLKKKTTTVRECGAELTGAR